MNVCSDMHLMQTEKAVYGLEVFLQICNWSTALISYNYDSHYCGDTQTIIDLRLVLAYAFHRQDSIRLLNATWIIQYMPTQGTESLQSAIQQSVYCTSRRGCHACLQTGNMHII